jgi:hypothetical protein
MKLKNINGTSGLTCSCGSWLKHWAKFSGQNIPTYCVETSCYQKPEVGAHVQKDSSTDRNWYIVPLCSRHNAKADTLIVGDYIALVPANVSETCNKNQYGTLTGLRDLYSLRR